MPVEARQPSSNLQNMAYRMDMAYQADGLWDYGSHSINHGDRPHHATQVYNSNDCVPNLKDGYSDELEVGESAVTGRANGPSHRRPFQNPEDRLQTAQTRRNKACLRCRMQKVRVLKFNLPPCCKRLTEQLQCNPDPSNPLGVCLTCQKVTSLKVPNLPCVRFKITETILFKPGPVPGLEWTHRWRDMKVVDISEWRSPTTKRILTSEGFSSTPVELEVREFVPQEGDVLERHWHGPGGTKQSVKVPCFAIADMNTAKQAYIDYINQAGPEFFKGWFQGKDELLNKTYSAALATANDSMTVSNQYM